MVMLDSLLCFFFFLCFLLSVSPFSSLLLLPLLSVLPPFIAREHVFFFFIVGSCGGWSGVAVQACLPQFRQCGRRSANVFGRWARGTGGRWAGGTNAIKYTSFFLLYCCMLGGEERGTVPIKTAPFSPFLFFSFFLHGLVTVHIVTGLLCAQ